jgi:disulfide bond formation protein DsbB
MKPTVLVLVLALMSAGAIVALQHSGLAETTTYKHQLAPDGAASTMQNSAALPDKGQASARQHGSENGPGQKAAYSAAAKPVPQAEEGLATGSSHSGKAESLPAAGSALPLLSVIGFGVLLGGIASALKTR